MFSTNVRRAAFVLDRHVVVRRTLLKDTRRKGAGTLLCLQTGAHTSSGTLFLEQQNKREEHDDNHIGGQAYRAKRATPQDRRLDDDFDLARDAQLIFPFASRLPNNMATGGTAKTPSLRLSDLSLGKMTRSVAAHRHLSGLKVRVKDFEDVFRYLPPAEAQRVQAEVEFKISTGQAGVLPEVWARFVNVLYFCEDWGDAVMELQAAASMQSSNTVEDPYHSPKVWPPFILWHAFCLVRTPQDAAQAIEILSRRLDEMRVRHSVTCFQKLNRTIHDTLNAAHLSRSTTDIALRIAERIVKMPDEAVQDCRLSPFTSRDATLQVLVQQVTMLMRRSEDRTRVQVRRIIEWAQTKLHIDDADRLRMQVLEVFPQHPLASSKPGHIRSLDWHSSHWKLRLSRQFADTRLARRIIVQLMAHGRSGHGLEKALKSALMIAAREKDEEEAAWLQGKAGSLIEQGRINSAFHTSPLMIKAWALRGETQEAWAAFHTNLERGRAGLLYWAVVVGLAAQDRGIATSFVWEMAGLNSEHGTIEADCQKGALKDVKPAALAQSPLIYSALIANLPRRRDPAGYQATLNVWQEMDRRGVTPDAASLGAYCQALARMERCDEVIQTLDRWVGCGNELSSTRNTMDLCTALAPAEGPRVIADWKLFHLVLISFLNSNEWKRVYEVFRDMQRKYDMRHHVSHLVTLLRAARQATHSVLKQGADQHPFLAAILAGSLTSKDPRHRLKEQADWDDVLAADRARAIFRHQLFTKHPELLAIASPLEDGVKQGGDLQAGRKFEGSFPWQQEVQLLRFETWLSNHFYFPQSSTKTQLQEPDAMHAGDVHGGSDNRAQSDVAEISFDAHVFHHYLLLLPLVQHDLRDVHGAKGYEKIGFVSWDERFTVLAWMRALDVKPMPSTLCLLCSYLDEILPPAWDAVSHTGSRYSNSPSALHKDHLSAAGPLHGYLSDWLGEEAIPTKRQVGKFVRDRLKQEGGYTD